MRLKILLYLAKLQAEKPQLYRKRTPNEYFLINFPKYSEI